MPDKTDRQKAAEIVRDAGGTIVGRTRLQKVACLLELAGFESGFDFEYHYYGPYSESLTEAIRMAEAFGLVTQQEKTASWGGKYSIFTATDAAGAAEQERATFAHQAASIDAIELELATTAAFLAAVEGAKEPWAETARRKPEKSEGGRIERAKAAYQRLLAVNTPKPLPPIA